MHRFRFTFYSYPVLSVACKGVVFVVRILLLLLTVALTYSFVALCAVRRLYDCENMLLELFFGC
jgi:hypothetical protein